MCPHRPDLGADMQAVVSFPFSDFVFSPHNLFTFHQTVLIWLRVLLFSSSSFFFLFYKISKNHIIFYHINKKLNKFNFLFTKINIYRTL